LKLLPGSLPPPGFGIVGIPLLRNAGPELVPVLSVQGLVPGIIIASIGTELAALLCGALSTATGFGSGGSHGVTVLRAGSGDAVVWNGALTKSGGLGDGHGLCVGGLGVDGVKACN